MVAQWQWNFPMRPHFCSFCTSACWFLRCTILLRVQVLFVLLLLPWTTSYTVIVVCTIVWPSMKVTLRLGDICENRFFLSQFLEFCNIQFVNFDMTYHNSCIPSMMKIWAKSHYWDSTKFSVCPIAPSARKTLVHVWRLVIISVIMIAECITLCKAYVLVYRIVDKWNSQSDSCISCTTIHDFKSHFMCDSK